MLNNNNPIYLFFLFVLTLCASLAIAEEGSAPAQAKPEKIPVLGVQLYTLRGEAEKNLENVFNKITIMGYEQVEMHSYYGLTPGKIKLLLDKYRLQAYATHRSYQAITEDLMGLLRDATILKWEYVIVPWIDIKQYNTKEKWIEFSQSLDRIGYLLKSHNLRLAYHNHEFEFLPLADGSIPYDILIANTNPKNVALQLDLFWITKAGKDPIKYIEENSGRFFSVHIKDMDKDGNMTEVGAGTIDFKQILKVAKQHGLKYYIVEHDNPQDPFKSVEASIQYLKQIEI